MTQAANSKVANRSGQQEYHTRRSYNEPDKIKQKRAELAKEEEKKQKLLKAQHSLDNLNEYPSLGGAAKPGLNQQPTTMWNSLSVDKLRNLKDKKIKIQAKPSASDAPDAPPAPPAAKNSEGDEEELYDEEEEYYESENMHVQEYHPYDDDNWSGASNEA
jgi:hypothetical protein